MSAAEAFARGFVFRDSHGWPFWADPSLRTIFPAKNEQCYRRYIGRITLPLTNRFAPGSAASSFRLSLHCTNPVTTRCAAPSWALARVAERK